MKIKNLNDVLIFKVDDILFDDFLIELDKLLDQAIFDSDCFYPKAFFDFNGRKIEDYEIISLINLLKKKEKILFYGVNLNKVNENLQICYEILRNGDVYICKDKTLFMNPIHPGALIYCYDDAYFLKDVRGTIIVKNADARIYAHQIHNSAFVLNNHILQDVTTSANVCIYYNGKELLMKKEDDEYVSNYNGYFR